MTRQLLLTDQRSPFKKLFDDYISGPSYVRRAPITPGRMLSMLGRGSGGEFVLPIADTRYEMPQAEARALRTAYRTTYVHTLPELPSEIDDWVLAARERIRKYVEDSVLGAIYGRPNEVYVRYPVPPQWPKDVAVDTPRKLPNRAC